jgi:hypothetical protein
MSATTSLDPLCRSSPCGIHAHGRARRPGSRQHDARAESRVAFVLGMAWMRSVRLVGP